MKRTILFLIFLTGCIQETPISNDLETPEYETTTRPAPGYNDFEERVAKVQEEWESRSNQEKQVVNIRLEGEVRLLRNTTRVLSKLYNTSLEKREVEWGVCFYGQSYEVSQNFTGYFPTTMIKAKTRNAEAKEVILTCDLNYDGESFIGTAHIHHNNNILPSFLDTTTWAHLPGKERKFHCVFIDDMKINCYSWKGYPILMN